MVDRIGSKNPEGTLPVGNTEKTLGDLPRIQYDPKKGKKRQPKSQAPEEPRDIVELSERALEQSRLADKGESNEPE